MARSGRKKGAGGGQRRGAAGGHGWGKRAWVVRMTSSMGSGHHGANFGGGPHGRTSARAGAEAASPSRTGASSGDVAPRYRSMDSRGVFGRGRVVCGGVSDPQGRRSDPGDKTHSPRQPGVKPQRLRGARVQGQRWATLRSWWPRGGGQGPRGDGLKPRSSGGPTPAAIRAGPSVEHGRRPR